MFAGAKTCVTEKIVRLVVPVLFIGLILSTWSFASDASGKVDPEFNVTIQLFEVRGSVLSDLGIDLSQPEFDKQPPEAGDFQMRFDDLKRSKKLKIIAEPGLLVTANKKGNFFSGGEFAIPVSTSEGKTVEEMREFGTRAEVTPVLQDDGRVKLQWYISQSEKDRSVGVRYNGKLIPGINRRRLAGNDLLSLGEPLCRIFGVDYKGNVLLVRVRVDSN